MHVSPTPLCFTESVLTTHKTSCTWKLWSIQTRSTFSFHDRMQTTLKKTSNQNIVCQLLSTERERETVTNVFQTTRNTAFSKQHLWKRRSKRLYLITLPNNTCIYNECTWTHRHWFYDHRFAFCSDKLHFRLLLSRLIALLKDAEVLLQNEKRQLHLTGVGSGPSHLAILRWLTHIALGVVAPWLVKTSLVVWLLAKCAALLLRRPGCKFWSTLVPAGLLEDKPDVPSP